jgi:hypothetical protein
MDTFAAEQGADGKTTEDPENNIIHEAAQYVPLVGGLLHFVNVQYNDSFLNNEITKEENNPTKIHQ